MGYFEDCKRRGYALQLTPVSGRLKWKKMIDGVLKRFSGANTKEGYEKAFGEYLAFNNRPTIKDEGEALTRVKEALNWYEENGTPAGEEGNLHSLQTIAAFDITKPTRGALSFEIDGLTDTVGRGRWSERKRQPIKATPKIAAAVEQFIAGKTAEIKTGLAEATVCGLKTRLRRFKEICGQYSLDAFNGTLAEQFITSITAADLDNCTREHERKAVIQFCRWAVGTERLEKVPEYLRAKRFRKGEGRDGMPKRVKKSDLWTVEDFRAIAAHGEHWELYSLLGLNCGFTRSDLEHLTAFNPDTEIGFDFETGRLIHERWKNKRHQNSPRVNYKLWPRTLELLRKLGKRDGLALAMPSGERFLGDKRNQNFSREWNRLKFHKLHKMLRKTGTTELGLFGQIFLCDKTGIADIYYRFFDGKPHEDFDAALEKLGQKFCQA